MAHSSWVAHEEPQVLGMPRQNLKPLTTIHHELAAMSDIFGSSIRVSEA
jgi:hypothetical protein